MCFRVYACLSVCLSVRVRGGAGWRGYRRRDVSVVIVFANHRYNIMTITTRGRGLFYGGHNFSQGSFYFARESHNIMTGESLSYDPGDSIP